MILTKLYFADDDQEFTDRGMIACARCATQKERPADYRQGICFFAKNLHKRTVTGRMLKESVDSLIKNGCGKCGGIAINPRGSLLDGQIRVNFMRDSCETGVCGQNQSANALHAARAVNTQEKSVRHDSNVSPREDDPNSANTLLGINCKGSTQCKHACDLPTIKAGLKDLKVFIDQLSR